MPKGHDHLSPPRPVSASAARGAGERRGPERRRAEAEARFRLLAEAAPVGIFRFDAAGNCVYVNRRCCEMAGLSPEAALGEGWLQAIHAEDRDALYADWRRAVATGATLEREFRLQRPDGTVVTVLGRSAAERANGEIQGFVGTVTDISERQRAEQELARSGARLAAAQRIAHLGNWEWDIAQDNLAVSAEVCRMLGRFPQQLATYERFLEAVHPEDRARVARAVQAAVHEDAPIDIDYRIVGPDGAERIVHGQGEVIRDGAGEAVRVVGTVQDVTERKRVEADLQSVSRRLRTLSLCNGLVARVTEESSLLRKICRTLVRVGGYRLAWIMYAAKDTATLRCVAHAGDEALGAAAAGLKWTESEAVLRPVTAAMRSNRPIVTPDVVGARSSAVSRGEVPAFELGSSVALPLADEKGPFGVLNLYAVQPRRFARQELRMLRELAANLAFGITAIRTRTERDEAQQALEARERNLRAIIARDVDGVLVLDLEGRVLFANPAAEIMLGRPAEELRGQQLGLPLVTGEWTEVKPVRPDGKPIIAEMRLARTEWSSTPAHLVSMHDVTERRQLERERIEHLERLHRAMFQTIQAVAQTIEKRDPYTAGHHQRVAALAVAIGQEMGLPPDDLDGLRLAASIHDIGKIYVPAEILTRPGTLTPLEFEFIKTHPDVGYEIVKDVEFRWPIAEIIRQHHERLDGSGYPRGLRDGDIVAGARILAVADVVEAIASIRPYRAELGMQRALAEISENRGTLYDPEAVDACVRLIREKGYVLERPAYAPPETAPSV